MAEYYAVQRSTDHLAHYGVKGMKWGVRKAIATGNERALDRHFRKAAKKLRKLADIGLHSKKYAAKAAAYGAAAAGTATIAIPGTKGINSLLQKRAKRYTSLIDSAAKGQVKVGADVITSWERRAANSSSLGNKIEKWGNEKAFKPVDVIVKDPKGEGYVTKSISATKNQLLRAGTGLAALGLAAKAGQNAYRASHGAKYRSKAADFKTEMDRAFAGTKYEGKYVALPKKKRKR